MAKRNQTPATRSIVSFCLLGLVASFVPDLALAARPTCFGKPATMIVHEDARAETHGTRGDDVIVVYGPAPRVRGLGGDDRICSVNGGDMFYGGPGDDKLQARFYQHPRRKSVHWEGEAFGQGGNDLLVGDEWGYLAAGPGNDRLVGRGGLLGESGDDVLESRGAAAMSGGPGSDVMRGTPGHGDYVSFHGCRRGVVVNLGTGTATGWGNDILIDIEMIGGSEFDDVIIGNKRERDVLRGYGGDDLLKGRGGNDGLHGDDGSDALFGGPGHDRLDPGDGPGEKVVSGGSGNDKIDVNFESGGEVRAGTGDDYITGSSYGDRIFAGPGDDKVDAWDGGDDIYGGPGDDTVDAYDGGDDIHGGPGDDVLSGGRGSRVDSLLWGDLGRDAIDGGPGEDRCMAGESYSNCESFD